MARRARCQPGQWPWGAYTPPLASQCSASWHLVSCACNLYFYYAVRVVCSSTLSIAAMPPVGMCRSFACAQVALQALAGKRRECVFELHAPSSHAQCQRGRGVACSCRPQERRAEKSRRHTCVCWVCLASRMHAFRCWRVAMQSGGVRPKCVTVPAWCAQARATWRLGAFMHAPYCVPVLLCTVCMLCVCCGCGCGALMRRAVDWLSAGRALLLYAPWISPRPARAPCLHACVCKPRPPWRNSGRARGNLCILAPLFIVHSA